MQRYELHKSQISDDFVYWFRNGEDIYQAVFRKHSLKMSVLCWRVPYMLWYSCVLLRQKMHFKKWNQYAYLEFSVKLLFLKHLLRFTLMLTTNWTIWWNLWNCEPRPGTTCNNSNRNHFLAETQAALGRNCSFLLILNSFKIISRNMVAGRSLQEKRLLEPYIT